MSCTTLRSELHTFFYRKCMSCWVNFIQPATLLTKTSWDAKFFLRISREIDTRLPAKRNTNSEPESFLKIFRKPLSLLESRNSQTLHLTLRQKAPKGRKHTAKSKDQCQSSLIWCSKIKKVLKSFQFDWSTSHASFYHLHGKKCRRKNAEGGLLPCWFKKIDFFLHFCGLEGARSIILKGITEILLFWGFQSRQI